MNLVIKLFLGILVGFSIGYLHLFFDVKDNIFLMQLLVTFKTICSQFIGFVIPLLILFYIMSGISSLRQQSGKLLGITVGFSYASTLIAGGVAFAAASYFLPMFNLTSSDVSSAQAVKSLITIKLTPVMEITTALLLAFLFGIGITVTKSIQLKQVVEQGKNIIDWILTKLLIPALPFYIAAIFAEMSFNGVAVNTLSAFILVLGLAILLHWLWLTMLYLLTGIMYGRNPLSLIKSMLPAYFTAIGTMSSAATIPVSVQSVKNMKVNNRIAEFVVPLCATIHLSGSVITIMTCAVAVIFITPELMLPTWGQMIPFLLLLSVTMVAAPGVPGGAVMAALGILSTSLGFTEGALALMVTLYMAQDSFGTACNVTGDGVIALWVNRFVSDERQDVVLDIN